MTLFVSFLYCGIGAEAVWPVYQIRLLLVIFGVEFGGYLQSWQRALAAKASDETDRLSPARGILLAIALGVAAWGLLYAVWRWA